MAQPVNRSWPTIPPGIRWNKWKQQWQGRGPNRNWDGLKQARYQWQGWGDEWSGGDSFIILETNFVNWEGWDEQNWNG
ncbi:MAG: hypothetical protein CMM08_02360 [Rhodospirillaceae bacterium]|jgi:hypothetical protein|nr:hypothetical protein [Rhodospirillaceae bacterium]MDP6624381.1 hypothetical protein [Alphaproteobacteria bacterium]|tara:strand:- start:2167 stop:2400 length:234 start_codon:yes stop_codon:yes gene_type:complete